jgi:hypothetical protein
MTQDEITGKIEAALGMLAEKDQQLLEFEANERSITHKLAQYLQPMFPEYDTDCEYNRIGTEGTAKKLYGLQTDSGSGQTPVDDLNATTVYPDIVVHKRGGTEVDDNLLVIEAKKAGLDTTFDKLKLETYKRQLGYGYAVLIIFPVPHKSFSSSAVTFI